MYGWGFSCSLVGLVLIIAIMSSSDSLELMVDGVDVCASPAQFGGGADIDSESSCSEDDDPEFMWEDAKPPPKLKRQRSVPPLVTTGGFWTLVVHAGGGPGGESTEQVHGVAKVTWKLEEQGDGACGCIQYEADQVFWLATPADLPHKRSDVSPPLLLLAAMNACADAPVESSAARSSSSVAPSLRSCVATQGSVQRIMWASSQELGTLRHGSPNCFRIVPIHKRGSGARSAISSSSSTRAMRDVFRFRALCEMSGPRRDPRMDVGLPG